MIDIEIREAKAEDWKTIFKLLKENNLYLEDFEEIKSNFIVAIYEDKIVGCITHRVLDKDVIQIKSVVVVKAYRGKGIGRKLNLEKIKSAKENGFREAYVGIFKTNETGNALYKSLGFGGVDREKLYRYFPKCTMCGGDFGKMPTYCMDNSEDRKCPVNTYFKLI